MAVSKKTKPKSQEPARMGRPPITDFISIEEITDIMLEYSAFGYFFQQMPAAIHKKTKQIVSLSYLEQIKDENFLRAKSLAFAYCTAHWTEKAELAGIPSAMWIFIMKNVGNWRDQKQVMIEADVKTESIDGKKKLEQIKRMLSDQV